MNILRKLTLKDLKLNKKRTIGTIIGVILSCALILVVGGFFFILHNTLMENEIKYGGYYHVLIDNLTDKQVQELKLNRAFKDITVVNKVGVAITKLENIDDFTKENIIYSYSKEIYEKIKYEVIEGKFPKNSNEILIDRAYKFSYDTEVGDIIELDIDGVKKSYTVSGISNQYGEFITTGVESSTYKAFLTLKNPRNYKKDINELLVLENYKNELESPIYGNDYSVREQLLMLETLSFDSEYKIIVDLFAAVIFVIMVTSIFAIRNSFAISVSEKIKMYGMLSSVGATKKQIKKMVLFEGFLIGLIGIIIGIFFGIFVTWFLTFVINYISVSANVLQEINFVYNFNILPVIIAILTSLIVIYLSVISGARKASKTSPIQNIRNAGDIKNKKIRTPKFINKIFGIGGVISYKNLKRSKKKYRVTIISLTVSVFIFIVASSLIDYSLKMVNIQYANLKYNVYLGNAEFINEHLDELQRLDNSYTMYNAFNDLSSYKIKYSSHFNKDLMVLSSDDGLEVIYNYFLYDDESFKKVMNDLNLDYEYMKDKIIILNKIRNPRNEKRYINVTDYKKGDVLELVNQTSHDSDSIILDIGAVLVDNYPVGLERIMQSNTLNIVGNYKYLNKDCFESHISYIYYDSEDPYELVKKINEIDKNIYVDNIEENVSQNKSMMLIFSIVAYSFILVLTLIGVTSVFNTINSNMELRKSEFATLKSVGMTKKEFNRMINLESFFYSLKSLFYGLILGLIGSYVVFKIFEFDYSFSYILPLKAIILAIVFIVVIVLIIMRYSIKKINKYNIIETIRNNNV